MRAGKAQILGALAADIRALELREGASYPLYEEWIAAGLNNARLASVSTYFDCLPGFTRLLARSEEHTSELQSQSNLVCRLLLEKKKSSAAPSAHCRRVSSAPRRLSRR